MARRRSRRRTRPQPLDRLALMVMAGLSLAMGLLILSGDHATARVRDFTWQDRQVGAEDRAFLLTFSRPMDVASVEQNLTLDPPLPGKVSWAGRRMAYTLTEPLPYGQAFKVSLAQARDRYATRTDQPTRFEPFQSQFETRQRGFLYIGAEGEEANRLVLANLDRQERTILTPTSLSVMAFTPYPLGDRVLFSASDTDQGGSLLNQQLYTVTTGITPRPPEDFTGKRPPFWTRLLSQSSPSPSGELKLILDSENYQNLKFDLSADGETIVVQRVNQQNPADFGPWLLQGNQTPKPIQTEPGGDFLITPDSQSLLLLQGQGTAIIDLNQEADSGPRQPLDFLPNYGQVFDIAADGSAAAMVNFNQDDPDKRFTQSLFLVTNQGREEELLQVSGSFQDAQFSPDQQVLYVLASELVEGTAAPESGTLAVADAFVEQPLLLAISLTDGEVRPLLRLPQQQQIHMSVAPDGRSLLLDLAGQAGSPDPAQRPRIWHLPVVQPSTQALAPSVSNPRALEAVEGSEANEETSPAAGAVPAVVDPEIFPFGGIRATWLP